MSPLKPNSPLRRHTPAPRGFHFVDDLWRGLWGTRQRARRKVALSTSDYSSPLNCPSTLDTVCITCEYRQSPFCRSRTVPVSTRAPHRCAPVHQHLLGDFLSRQQLGANFICPQCAARARTGNGAHRRTVFLAHQNFGRRTTWKSSKW